MPRAGRSRLRISQTRSCQHGADHGFSAAHESHRCRLRPAPLGRKESLRRLCRRGRSLLRCLAGGSEDLGRRRGGYHRAGLAFLGSARGRHREPDGGRSGLEGGDEHPPRSPRTRSSCSATAIAATARTVCWRWNRRKTARISNSATTMPTAARRKCAATVRDASAVSPPR